MAKRGTRRAGRGKRGTRRSGRGIVGRVAAPVGAAVNMGANLVKTAFKGARNLGRSAVNGANKVINSVGKSFRGKKQGGGRRRKATRRRKN
jgi:hypothetical protein